MNNLNEQPLHNDVINNWSAHCCTCSHVLQYSAVSCNYESEGSLYLCSYSKLVLWDTTVNVFHLNISAQRTAELHLSGLTGTKSHPDMKEMWVIGFLLENKLPWQFEVRLLLFTVCTCI